jgi:lactate dehydrogenase-like 2-hydroxyacid dehydrogenase
MSGVKAASMAFSSRQGGTSGLFRKHRACSMLSPESKECRMAKPVLLITRHLPSAVEARAARDYDARLNPEDRRFTSADVIRLAEGADAVLLAPSEKMDAATIRALPASVKVLGTFSVGFDHVDLAALRARGLPLVNTPDVLSVATAECALTLMLAAARRAGEGERLVRSGHWVGLAPTQFLGTQVSGRRLGIFGLGRIGRELARMATALRMQVHYRDVQRLPAELEHGAIYHDNDESFLPVCDVLSLHAPGGEATRRWLNAERIAKLPRGAVVVNAARGTLVDDAALIAALRSGQVAYAGLDVYDGEPVVNPGYLELENVFLLPHLGSATVETRDAMGFAALDGIDAVLAGRKPANLVP